MSKYDAWEEVLYYAFVASAVVGICIPDPITIFPTLVAGFAFYKLAFPSLWSLLWTVYFIFAPNALDQETEHNTNLNSQTSQVRRRAGRIPYLALIRAEIGDCSEENVTYRLVSRPHSRLLKGCFRSPEKSNDKKMVRLVEPSKTSLVNLRELWSDPTMVALGLGGVAGYRKTADTFIKGKGGTGTATPPTQKVGRKEMFSLELDLASREDIESDSDPDVQQSRGNNPTRLAPPKTKGRSNSLLKGRALGGGRTSSPLPNRKKRNSSSPQFPAKSSEESKGPEGGAPLCRAKSIIPISVPIVLDATEDDDGFEDCSSGASTPTGEKEESIANYTNDLEMLSRPGISISGPSESESSDSEVEEDPRSFKSRRNEMLPSPSLISV